MKNIILLPLLAFLIVSCSSNQLEEETPNTFFSGLISIPENFNTDSLIIPSGYSYQILFSEYDTVMNSEGMFAPAKGKHDCVTYIPIDGSSTHGHLVVGHETGTIDDILGDGGGATILEIKKVNEEWIIIGEPLNLDFRSVGGTYNNCGGKVNPKGTFFTAEEDYFSSQDEYIKRGFSYTDSIDGYAAFENFGWIVESSIEKGASLQKLYGMGRYKHEDAYCLDDHRTVFLSNDESPAVFFKFVANQPDHFTRGSLFGYCENCTTPWIPIPDTKEALLNARDTAIALGATMFIRHEWISKIGNKIYIAETGRDTLDISNYSPNGGKPASYFTMINEGVISDPHGRILEYDLLTQKITPAVVGGQASNTAINFSSPDCILAFTDDNGKQILISEDITSLHFNKVSGNAKVNNHKINEVYLAELDSHALPLKPENLLRFAIGPKGSETTGLYMTPDQKTLFMAIQHPNTDNPAPFNKSCVVAITKD